MSEKHKKDSENVACLKDASKQLSPVNIINDMVNRLNNAVDDLSTISNNIMHSIFNKTKGWFKK